MKTLLIPKTILIFVIALFQFPVSAGEREPLMNSLELSGTVKVGVDSDERLYEYLKHILTREYCATDHFTSLRMNKNQKTFHCTIENSVTIKRGLTRDNYSFSYNIQFTVNGNGYDYEANNFRFCHAEKVKNDENCTLLTSVLYSGKNKVKTEKQMKAIAITDAEYNLLELISSIRQISPNGPHTVSAGTGQKSDS